MLSLIDILEYLNAEMKDVEDGSRRCLKEGEAIVQSKHIISCGLMHSDNDKENMSGSSTVIGVMALCLQTSQMSGVPHQIKVLLDTKTKDSKIKKATCTCKAGLSGACKHVTGVLLHIYRYVHWLCTNDAAFVA